MEIRNLPAGTGRLIEAASTTSSDILYGSGFHAADDFIYFEMQGMKAVVVSMLEYQRALQEVHKGVEVIDRIEILRSFPREEYRQDFLVLLSRKYQIRRWIVPGNFPLSKADTLRAAGICVESVSGDFFPERDRKNPTEVEAIRASMRATENAMRQVEHYLRESIVNKDGILVYNDNVLTCEYIRAEVEAEFKRNGYSADRTIIACGKDASAPHCIGFGPVYAGQPVVADIFPRSDRTGYWGDMTRTFVKGQASEIVRKAFKAVKLASEESLKILKAGVPGADVHRTAARTMEQAGFRTGRDANGIPCGFIHGLGHGVGLDIHENPRLSPANPNPLAAGCVVSVEPGLYDPSWGGIRLEDLVLVTDDGYENFCTMPKELEIP